MLFRSYITERTTGDVVKVTDTGFPLSAGSKKWVMRGYAKDEILELVSYTIFYSSAGINYKPFRTTDTGSNA